MRRGHGRSSALIAAVLWTVVALTLAPRLLEDVELWAYDTRQRVRGSDLHRRDDVVVVAVDAQTTDVFGWPIPRARWAECLAGLSTLSPRQIGLDLFLTHHLCAPRDDTLLAEVLGVIPTVMVIGLDLPVGKGERLPQEPSPADSLLVRWWHRSPSSRGVRQVLHSSGVSERPLAVLARGAAGVGHATLDPDRDGVIRRIPLIIEYGGFLVPSFSLALLLQREGIELGECTFLPGKSLTLPGRRPIPLDARSRMILRFSGGPETFTTFTLVELMGLLERALLDEDEAARRALEPIRGATVIIGVTDPAQMDLPPTPPHPRFPGPEIHATGVDNLLRCAHVHRAPWGMGALATLVLSFVGALVGTKLRPIAGAVAAVVAALAFAGASTVLDARMGLWIPTVAPLVALAGSVGTNVTLERRAREREQRLVKDAFGKYVSPEALRRLLEDPKTVLGRRGEKKSITILFSDVKGFSALCEEHEPDALLTQLNEYLGEMTDIVFACGGTVDKFMGDGLMAFFGHPVPVRDHARRAVEAAVRMQGRLRELRERWAREGKTAFHVRIGINTGEVIAGSMGGGRKLDYTVFGRAVNLAQRLESNCDVDGVLVSKETLELAGLDPSLATPRSVSAKNIGTVVAYQIPT